MLIDYHQIIINVKAFLSNDHDRQKKLIKRLYGFLIEKLAGYYSNYEITQITQIRNITGKFVRGC